MSKEESITRASYREKVSDESLPIKLTDVQRLGKADDLAEKVHEVERLKSARKSALAQYNGEIQLAEAQRSVLSNVVASGTEYRDIPVTCRIDWETGKYSKTRQDTGEMFFERPLNQEEKQLDILES
jgi:hypothetical protein